MDQPSLPKDGTPTSRGGRVQRLRRQEFDGCRRAGGGDEFVLVARVSGGFDWVGDW